MRKNTHNIKKCVKISINFFLLLIIEGNLYKFDSTPFYIFLPPIFLVWSRKRNKWGRKILIFYVILDKMG